MKNYKQLGEAASYPVHVQCLGLDTDRISIGVPVDAKTRVVWFPRSLLPETLKDIQLRDKFQVDIKVSNTNGDISFQNAKEIT